MTRRITNIVFCLILLASTNVRAQHDTCRVALMVPLYLEQIDEAFIGSEPSNGMLKTKPFSFLHFYEGFMIAADSVANTRGMFIDMKVYDVDNDVKKADTAIIDPWLAAADMIVGPFYLKPFEVVKRFASENGIPIVNPITPRSNIVDNHPNVIKVKPSMDAQMTFLDSIVRKYYHANNVFIIREKADKDAAMIAKINEIVKRNIDSCSYIPNSHIVKVIKNNFKRWKLLKVDFEVSDYLTDNIRLDINILKNNIDDSTAFRNQVININYERDSLKFVKNYASSMRNNLFIVYGTGKVFANEIVNKVTKLTENYPLTVIMLPEWGRFEGLFNDNLMKMRAIYFEDYFIDYQDVKVESFICKFRNRYNTEPAEYAFDGFDIGWYFLNAYHLFGEEMTENLSDYDVPLLHTKFHFQKNGVNSGFENTFWNIYQFKGYNKVVLGITDEK